MGWSGQHSRNKSDHEKANTTWESDDEIQTGMIGALVRIDTKSQIEDRWGAATRNSLATTLDSSGADVDKWRVGAAEKQSRQQCRYVLCSGR